MRLLKITFWILIFCQLNAIAKEIKEFPKPQEETQNEKDWREFKEFQEMREKQEREGVGKEESIDLVGTKKKKWYLFLQGGTGSASTQYENGKIQFTKAGFEYRMSPNFGIGFSVGNNNLDLKSKDTSYSLALAYLLSSALNTTSSGQTQSAQNQLLFTAILTSPVSYFYFSNTFNYRYNTAQVDFNMHFNRENFFDPYIGLGIIAGICGATYPCSVTGGELKLGAQLNFESFFAFIQLQGQVINIKEPGFASFQSQHSIASLGIGIKF